MEYITRGPKRQGERKKNPDLALRKEWRIHERNNCRKEFRRKDPAAEREKRVKPGGTL
jgi:hypothetical protein